MTDADFSLLDLPQVRGMMFYPRRDRTPARAGAHDIFIAVEGARLHARRYVGEPDRPTVLLFHGNGEVVADYDDIAPVYAYFGLNLVVADFRGYGQSDGSPSYTAMMADAHAVKRAVFDDLDGAAWLAGRYLMGRSLGALSAVELAATAADGFCGVVFESGAANLGGWARRAPAGSDAAAWGALAEAQLTRIASIRLPLLTIHGAEDELIPVERALETHEAAGSAEKELVVVEGAGHNDLMAVGLREYFEALAAFAGRGEG